jgi:succinate dehydrogenase/fumarate reductase flavoprotein subunit
MVAARATLEGALERRETRGCPNRSDYPAVDPSLQVNLVWSGPGQGFALSPRSGCFGLITRVRPESALTYSHIDI